MVSCVSAGSVCWWVYRQRKESSEVKRDWVGAGVTRGCLHKLLVGGIFCDLEKAFDCVNHDVLLPKLKFYWIGDKDFQLYQSCLGNRYCRTAIYNDSENSNKVSNWTKVKHGVPQGFILGPPLFLLYINDLPKIINKSSAPIIFADDTSVLFAHSNPIDFNKNIYIVFITLNKWLRAKFKL